MGKFSSSLQNSKPLLLLSLAVSLALHAGGLYLLFKYPFAVLSASTPPPLELSSQSSQIEENIKIDFALSDCLNRLIIYEDPGNISFQTYRPQLEWTDLHPFIVTNMPRTHPPLSPPSSTNFIFEPTSPSLIEAPFSTPKTSPFKDKKTINFTRNLSLDLVTKKNLQREQAAKNHTFLSKVSPTLFNIETPSSTPPFKLDLPSTASSVCNLLELETSPLKSTTPLQQETQASFLVPSVAKREKIQLEKDLFFFFIESEIPSTPPYVFTYTFDECPELMCLSSPQKETIASIPSFAHFYFDSIPHLNLSILSDRGGPEMINPILEENEKNLFPSNKEPFFALQTPRSRDLTFTPIEIKNFPELPRVQIMLSKSILTKEVLVLEDIIGFNSKIAPQSLSKNQEPQFAYKPQKESFHKPALLANSQPMISTKPILFSFFYKTNFVAANNWSLPKQSTSPSFKSDIDIKELIPKLTFPLDLSHEELVFLPSHEQELDLNLAARSAETLLQHLSLSFEPNLYLSTLPFQNLEFDRTLPLISIQMDVPLSPLLTQSKAALPNPPYIATKPSSSFSSKHKPTPEPVQIHHKEKESTLHFEEFSISHDQKELPLAEETSNLALQLGQKNFPKYKPKDFDSSLTLKQSKQAPLSVNITNAFATVSAIPTTENEHAAFEYSPSHPHLTSPILPPYPTNLPILSLNEEMTVSLKQQGLKPLKKETILEHRLNLPPLPNIKDSLSTTQTPENALKNLLASEEVISTTSRSSNYPQTKQPYDDISCLNKGLLKQPPLHKSISQSNVPPFYRLEAPPLKIDNELMPSLKEQELKYVKNWQSAEKSFPEKELPTLPSFKERTFAPDKKVFFPKEVLQDLPIVETFLAKVFRSPKFPQTQALLNQLPAPEIEMTDWTPSIQAEFRDIETNDFESDPQKIIAAYEKEKIVAALDINLAKPKLITAIPKEEAHILNDSQRLTQTNLTQIPTPLDLETLSYDDSFQTEVQYKPRNDGEGYYFAIKMKPKKELEFGSPKQNFIFIIDGSGTIKKHRYNVFKDGVGRALKYLKKGDSFNILVADSKVEAYGSKPIRWSPDAMRHAKCFLEHRSYRGYFSNYDAFYLLKKAEKFFIPNKYNVVVLITDGHSFGTIKNHKEDLIKLSEESRGKFSLFTATASQNNNLPMLDLVSTFNNGEMIYSPTHAAFPRKLAVLVKHIENFIAKDLRIHVTTHQNSNINFYPNAKTLPSIYSDRPYIIYGTTKSLKDFDLMIQGRSGNHFINIRQHISFKKAEKAGNKLERNFALQQAYACYDYYLEEANPFFLREAERLLNPHTIPSAAR